MDCRYHRRLKFLWRITMTTLALVGCAHIHTPGFIKAIKARPDLKVKSIWDHDSARAEKRAAELGAKVVNDPRAIFDDAEISAAVICSETDRHEALVAPAAAAGKHLFVEKPLGIGAKDAYAMADAIEKAGVKFQTGYFSRGAPNHRFIKEQIDKSGFGRITRVRGSVCHSGAINGWFDTEWRWMADVKQAGVGAFGDLGTHALDLLIWWMGDVDSCAALLDPGTARYPGCDEFGESLMRFKSGAIGTLAASWDDVANPVTYQVNGTEANAVIVKDQLFFQSKHIDGADGKHPWTNLPDKQPAGFEAFLDAVSGKEALLVKPREAAYRSAVMEAMYQSARESRRVAPGAP
jgi:predicted dehydrogenase